MANIFTRKRKTILEEQGNKPIYLRCTLVYVFMEGPLAGNNPSFSNHLIVYLIADVDVRLCLVVY